jgi:hypothetical protein
MRAAAAQLLALAGRAVLHLHLPTAGGDVNPAKPPAPEQLREQARIGRRPAVTPKIVPIQKRIDQAVRNAVELGARRYGKL